METKPLKYEKLRNISDKALAIHHDKLYAGYVAKVDEINKALGELRSSGSAAGNATYSQLRALKDAETFAVNGVYLHEWYFDGLGGDGNAEDAPELSKALGEKWGSVADGLKYFSECAMAARGWSVLAWDIKAGKLNHYNSDAHNQGGVWGCIPVIVLDCYEHAYFMDFGSDKKAYVQAFWENLDWKAAETLYLKARDISL
ncbi:MAG TPA: Fe-Mn family superoxide dismutase [Candidatus Paceibacterota bacterium]|nr:Fe-Mn family superoxide dismutase [Candidatus Paceibacterota bacterium]